MKDTPEEYASALSVGLDVGCLIDNRYVAVRELGRGGMGTVYQATDTLMARTVAIKILHSGKSADEKARTRFMREAKAISLLSHPNIVKIHNYGRSEQFDYLVMDYVEGTGLDILLSRLGKLDYGSAVNIVSQAAAALHHAHLQGIVHRDIKPSNIMLIDRNGRQTALLLDFGIAKLTEEDSAQKLTATDAFLGTPYYMSPEQCLNQPIDCRSDVYSLGCVFYELLCGSKPFNGESPYAIAYAHISNSLPPLTAVPAWVNSIVRQATEKKPEDRFQTMAQLLTAIERQEAIADNSKNANQHTFKRKALLTSLALSGTVGLALICFGAYKYYPAIFPHAIPTKMQTAASSLPSGIDAKKSGLQALHLARESCTSGAFQTAVKQYHQAFLYASGDKTYKIAENPVIALLLTDEAAAANDLAKTDRYKAFAKQFEMERELVSNTIFWSALANSTLSDSQKASRCEQQLTTWVKQATSTSDDFIVARSIICNQLSHAYSHGKVRQMTHDELFTLSGSPAGRCLEQADIEAVIAMSLLRQQVNCQTEAQVADLRKEAESSFLKAQELINLVMNDPQEFTGPDSKQYKILVAATYRDLAAYLSDTKQYVKSAMYFQTASDLLDSRTSQ